MTLTIRRLGLVLAIIALAGAQIPMQPLAPDRPANAGLPHAVAALGFAICGHADNGSAPADSGPCPHCLMGGCLGIAAPLPAAPAWRTPILAPLPVVAGWRVRPHRPAAITPPQGARAPPLSA